jgi:hypothetical protein
MVAIAQKKFPHIEFREGDAQNLPFPDATFDRVLANFALLHLPIPSGPAPKRSVSSNPGGKFGFTVWAPPEENPYAKMIDDAIQAHADLDVRPSSWAAALFVFWPRGISPGLERVGFNGASMIFKLHTIRWNVPSACYPFDAERNAGVRTAGLLARQTSEKLGAIQLSDRRVRSSLCRRR